MTTVKLNELSNFIQEKIPQKPTLILLSGTLGSGKTTFSRTLLASLGLKSQSPTYVLINQFENINYKVYHLDLYRLTEKELNPELYFELQDIIHDESAYCLIEWPEKLQEFQIQINRPYILLNLNHTGNDEERAITCQEVNDQHLDH